VDSSVVGCGANPYNLAGAPVVRIVAEDIADADRFAEEIRTSDVIFNLAGEISHIHSMRQPWRDAELNAAAQLRFLEACARHAPRARIVYASTRQIYGAPRYLPVDENHPIQPVDFNGIHKYAATQYHLMYTMMGKVDAAVLCLTNVYGPRMALNIPCQGFLANFLRRSLLGQRIEVFGDGRQLRDPVYVDDVVQAFLQVGVAESLGERVWNLGGPEPLPLARIAEMISAAAGAPRPSFRPFPEEIKRIDIGSYVSSSARLQGTFGWKALVGFEEGVARSLDYYRDEFPHYLTPQDVEPSCALESQVADPPVVAVS
jgi:UDP-glucose 4-epimerase